MNSKSLIFNQDGDFIETDDKIDEKCYFCKYTCEPTEIQIYKILKNKKFKFIVDVYRIDGRSVYMEKLNTQVKFNQKLKNDILSAKNFLQSLGIYYIDWKLDNVGLSEDGNYKLFDFDCSGVADKTGKWILPPYDKGYMFRLAQQQKITDPLEIDNYLFYTNFF